MSQWTDAETRKAIELLASKGYTVWKDGAHIISDFEQRQHAERDARQRWLHNFYINGGDHG